MIRRCFCIPALAYVAVLFFIFFPVIHSPATRAFAGHQVAGLFIWEFWWFKFSFLNGLNPFFTQFLFFPVGTPIVLQSPLLLGLSLFLQLGMNVYATYNVLSFLAFLGSGLSMYSLAHYLTRHRPSAFLAGYFFMFGHYSLTQQMLGHLNQATLFFIPLIFLGALKMRSGDNQGWLLFTGGLLGGVLVSTYFSFQILFVGLPVFLGALLLAEDREIEDRKAYLRRIGLSVLAAGLGGLLFYWPLFLHHSTLIGESEMSSLDVLSLFDFPAWHALSWMRHIQKPEDRMGFFGVSVGALLTAGFFLQSYKGLRAWWIMAGAGLLFSFGPYLRVGYESTGVPLPYLIFSHVPFLSSFRCPARMILFTNLAASVLAALVFKDVWERWRKPLLQWSGLIAFLMVFSWEMGVPVFLRLVKSVESGVYADVARSPQKGALLELPVAVYNQGEISLNAQIAMLYQPLHQKPLVVGRPSRHTRSSLQTLKSTEFLYELVHPHSLLALDSNADLSQRRRRLVGSGRSILKDLGISFVILHTEDVFFSPDVKKHLKRFLDDALEEPSRQDVEGRLLYVIN